ncbi:TPA: hypothetical protein RM193_002247 [Yersinia enterocolitica]|nr:hypothetical protein [Yersinia enterocolitica]
MTLIVDIQEVTKGSLYEVNYYDTNQNHVGGFGFKASSMEEAETLITTATRKQIDDK